MERKHVRSGQSHDASKSAKKEAAGSKATQFDGNPNPKGAPDGTFGPKDDTPLTLEKKKGPKA